MGRLTFRPAEGPFARRGAASAAAQAALAGDLVAPFLHNANFTAIRRVETRITEMMARSLRFFLLLLSLALPLVAGAAERVKWTASIPADAAGGAVVTATLKAEIEKGWNLYSINKVEGPVPTTVEAIAPATLAGKVEQSKPIKKQDPNFGVEVEYFTGEATFKVPLKLGPNPTEGKLKVRYQTCNDRTCDMPKTVEVPLTGEAAQATVVKSSTADQQEKGLLPFIGFAFGAGLLALLTPCVFPMIPITVSFFAKRRENLGNKAALGQAAAYCFGIVSAFTGFGLIVTILFGASGIQRFATNPIVNIVLAAIFVLLALNLFGMLQLTLPSKVTNAFNPHGKPGLLAPILMGLTFTLTSFTCTVPFVGTILVSAANGDYLYPLVGMLAFSSAFALPFFLLALFPQYLARLPKSGSWLEMVKAFMGFLELAAAVKFISNADLVWGTGLISRSAFLYIWAIILVGAALFLLRVIRLPKVDVPPKLGIGRLATVGATFLISGWLVTGARGVSLGEMEAFLPPGQSDGWIEDYDRAVQVARRDKKPILIDFTGVTCTNCRWMEKNMFPLPEVSKEMDNYVLVKLFTDRDQDSDRRNQALQQKLTGVVTLPVYAVVSPDEKVLKVFEGSTRKTEEYVGFLQKARTQLSAQR
jgi:thiol:disulfide interchange protein DsbD